MQLRIPVSGALFAVSWFVLGDALAVSFRDPDPAYHPTFLHCIPGVASTVGFFLLNLTSASRFAEPGSFAHSRQRRVDAEAAGILVGSWVLLFASVAASLWLCAAENLAPSSRRSPALGVAVVLHATLLTLSAAFFWCRRRPESDVFE